MVMNMSFIECYGLYLIALLAFATVHELLHYITAHILGFKPRFRFKTFGIELSINDKYDEKKNILDINDKVMLIKYIVIAIAPYIVIIPISIYILLVSSSYLLKLTFGMIIVLNLLNLPLEFING